MPPSLFDDFQEATGLPLDKDKDFAVVITQDCDLVCESYAAEPFVEVVRATKTPRLLGELTYSKSFRKLHLPLDQADGQSIPVQLSVHDKAKASRRLLEKDKPRTDLRLSDKNKQTLIGWLVQRYRRDPFPDAFMGRLKGDDGKGEKKLRKLLEDWGTEIVAILVSLSTEDELVDGTPYKMMVHLVFEEEYLEGGGSRDELEKGVLEPFRDWVSELKGIEADVTDIMLTSDVAINLNDRKRMRRLNLDDLSYRYGGPVAA